jgi:Kef-type K+ transport system membrane component KefB
MVRALRQPAVLGELLGGILLGPTVLVTRAPHAYEGLFPATGAITVGRDAVLKIDMLPSASLLPYTLSLLGSRQICCPF